MANTNVYRAARADGSTKFSRSTKRTYTHAVHRRVTSSGRYTDTFWCGSFDLADKKVRAEQAQDRKWGSGIEGAVVYELVPAVLV